MKISKNWGSPILYYAAAVKDFKGEGFGKLISLADALNKGETPDEDTAKWFIDSVDRFLSKSDNEDGNDRKSRMESSFDIELREGRRKQSGEQAEKRWKLAIAVTRKMKGGIKLSKEEAVAEVAEETGLSEGSIKGSYDRHRETALILYKYEENMREQRKLVMRASGVTPEMIDDIQRISGGEK